MHTNEGRDLIRRKLIIPLCMWPDYIKYEQSSMGGHTKRINEEHITSSYSWIGIGGGGTTHQKRNHANQYMNSHHMQEEDGGRRDETRPTLCPSNEDDDANADECYDFRFIAKFPFEQRQRRGHLHHHFADISARPSRSRQPTIPFNSQCSSSGSSACASKNGSVDFCVLLVGIGTFTWIYWKCVSRPHQYKICFIK